VTKYILDVQFTLGASVQTLLNFIGTVYFAGIYQVANTTDYPKLVKLGELLGSNNVSFGAGPVQDVCALQASINNLVASFLPSNQPTVQGMVSTYVGGVKALNGTVLAIVNYFDAATLNYLGNTENTAVLNALLPYQFIYNYL